MFENWERVWLVAIEAEEIVKDCLFIILLFYLVLHLIKECFSVRERYHSSLGLVGPHPIPEVDQQDIVAWKEISMLEELLNLGSSGMAPKVIRFQNVKKNSSGMKRHQRDSSVVITNKGLEQIQKGFLTKSSLLYDLPELGKPRVDKVLVRSEAFLAVKLSPIDNFQQS